MNALVAYSIDDNNFVLSPERVLFWEDRKTLIIADLHAGKTGHFRKSGIAIPQKVFREDLQRLLTQVLFFKAEELIIVGDFSHSKSNQELDLFVRWRHDLSSLKISLVKGNHDILQDKWYDEAQIEISSWELGIGNFLFRHDLMKKAPGMGNRQLAIGNTQTESRYIFSGHIHPGISIRGLAKQSLHFPCFYFTDNYCVLPAFSRFTGTHSVEPQKGENVFAIVENQILQVQ